MQLDLHHGLPDSMRQMLLGVAVCVVSVASPPVARAQGDVRVTTLAREDQVLVSFELLGAYTEEIRDVVASGLETTFSFAIELRQPVAFWFDRTIDRVSVAASVRYDGLTGRYRVRRIVDGRVEQVQVVEEEAAVRQLLTNLERLPLFSTRDLETNGDYRVRVRGGPAPSYRVVSLALGPCGGPWRGQLYFPPLAQSVVNVQRRTETGDAPAW